MNRSRSDKDEKIKISIILPSLNVADYIRECLESVVDQSLRDIEIICVDAGSTDGTLEIINGYAENDARVRSIISDKKSYGRQVNIGVEAAAGEYIGIVETDDRVRKDMFKELYDVAKKNDADLVKSDHYGFTGKGEGLKKEIVHLSADPTFYNRIINIGEERECFRFPINTWAGIYKRDFLLRHAIFHNETPGASFQDNGFWFLGFVYAKRAMFLDKPYYMHRMDNPDSSINSKEKVFCICDEFMFIRDSLKKDDKVFQDFKYTYTFSCYHAYMYHLNRIADGYQESFLKRFAEDLRMFYEQKELDLAMFKNDDRLFSIMDDPDKFYRRYILPKKKMRDELRSYEKVIVYGAGKVGTYIFDELVRMGLQEQIVCFAVSKKEHVPDRYHDRPVYEIDDLVRYRMESAVIIATSKVYHAKICENLKRLGFTHIYIGSR